MFHDLEDLPENLDHSHKNEYVGDKELEGSKTAFVKNEPNRKKLSDLTEAELDKVKNVSTFKPIGVSKKDAKKFLLSTDDGKELLRLTRDSARPDASIEEIIDRAIGYIQTADELPKLRHVDSPLVKIVPKGQDVSDYSPFFTTMEELKVAQTADRPLSDIFGLPANSDAPVYDVFQIKPKSGYGTVFSSKIASTQELGDKITTQGGATQFIVPNRSQFSAPEHLFSINDNIR